MTLYGIVSITLTLVFEEQIFASLGATKELFPVMSEYYRIIMPFVIFQLIIIPLYFFIRLDAFPTLSAISLVVGPVVNIALASFFLALYACGLTPPAWATRLP